MDLQRPTSEDPLFPEVIALAKKARDTVGFLPDSAFAQRADQGTLLVGVEAGSVAAYALYDLPREEIRLVHLVVDSSHRGEGIARGLVEEIAKSHGERRGIVLHCRNDFAAHAMWSHLDFVPVGERPGRNFEGKPLTRWFRPFGQPDLFSLLAEDDTRPLAVLDACVFFDLAGAPSSLPAKRLRADWIGDHVRLAVADQLFVEIARGKDPAERNRERAAAEPFRIPSTHASVWRRIYDALLSDHPNPPKKDLDDLKHVAQSIASQATWLITTDQRFVRRYSASAARIGSLSLVSPAAFVRAVDEQARSDRYRPVDLSNTPVRRREVGALALAGLADRFVNHAAGETIRELRHVADVAAARPAAVRLEVVEVDGETRGLLGSELTGDRLEVPLVRVTTGRGESTIARQLLGLVRDRAVEASVAEIRITDLKPSSPVQRSFRDEGFATEIGDQQMTAHAIGGSGSFEHLISLAKTLRAPGIALGMFDDGDLLTKASAAERWFAPHRVLGAGIPTYLVPIKHGFATALFDAGLAEGQLLQREWDLGLRRELVYFRSPRATPRGMRAPARLLWYVSGSQPGGGFIRATSQLTEVAVGAWKRLFHRFEALGAYDIEQVRASADAEGRVMALRFSQTELLASPVPLAKYRKLMTGDPNSKAVPLQSPQAVSERMFATILGLEPSSDPR